MLRKLLLLLALLVLAAIALVWLGIINWPGGTSVEVRPIDVKVESRNVALPLPVVEPRTGDASAAQSPPPAAGAQPSTTPPAAQPAPQNQQ
jgi:hypothetical protein